MRHGSPALCLVVLALLAPQPAAANRGDQKWFKTYPEATTNGHPASFGAGARQADGKVVIAGTARQQSGFGNTDWVVIRIDPATGALDPGFGTGGVARIPIDLTAGGADNAYGVVVAPSGRIYVAGDAQTPAGPSDMAVVALTPGGARDTGFGPQGLRTAAFFPNSIDRANAVVADDAGVTIGGIAGPSGSNQPGFALARFEHDGDPFPGFGTSGLVVTPLSGSNGDEIADLVPLADGGVVAVGGAERGFPEADVALVEYDTAGGVDASTVVAAPDREEGVDGILDGQRMIVGADYRDSSFTPRTTVAAYELGTFAPVGGYGGPTFSTPSLFGGLDREADGTIVAGGIAPFPSGSAVDDWVVAFLGAAGTPTEPLRTFPSSRDDGERTGQVVVSGATAVLVGSQAAPDRPAAAGVDLVRAPPGQIAQPPPPPPPPGCTADLRVLKLPFRPFSFISVLDSSTAAVSVGWSYAWSITVTNASSDCAATGVVVQDRIANFVYERHAVSGGTAEVAVARTAGGIGTEAAATVTAEIASIPPRASVSLVVHGSPADIGSARNQAIALWSGREARSNVLTLIVTPGPVSKVGTATAALIEGTAAASGPSGGDRAARAAQALPALHRLARVEVAVRRLGPRCRWLASRRARFRTVRTRGCPPVWLRARGTARWRLRFARRLPKGRYEVLTRALNRAGVSDDTFTRAERSRVSLRVR